ncbi:MAG TPA: hypothetical protein VKE88_02705 [Candidatus Nanoarchaeia archaeon]|nr:hypothetical protein [Candidatus Nanoarchaeia archaeon]
MEDTLEKRTFGNIPLMERMKELALRKGQEVQTVNVRPNYIHKADDFMRKVEEACFLTGNSTLNFRYAA